MAKKEAGASGSRRRCTAAGAMPTVWGRAEEVEAVMVVFLGDW
jgi:hypothetical protein